MSLNSVALSGNLGADAELRYTQGGTAVMSFSLAVAERVKQRDGTWEDRANWIRCTMFGKRAEALAPWLRRGNKVALTGRLHQTSWEKDGQTKSSVEVRVDEVELMSVSRERQQPAPAQPAAEAAAPAPAEAPGLYDDDIPF